MGWEPVCGSNGGASPCVWFAAVDALDPLLLTITLGRKQRREYYFCGNNEKRMAQGPKANPREYTTRLHSVYFLQKPYCTWIFPGQPRR